MPYRSSDLKRPFVMLGDPESPQELPSDLEEPVISWRDFLISIPCSALRDKLAESGYSVSDFGSDLMAGLVVALLAIPLGMALAISTGVAPQYGLYTVITAGFLTALLGGSRMQVSGPTAAFVPILAPIVSKFGLEGLITAGLISGLFQVAMGFAGFGKLVRFMPDTVLHGFTGGIATVIFSQQMKDFLGIITDQTSDHFMGKMIILISNLDSCQFSEILTGSATLTGIIIWSRSGSRIPAPIVVLGVVTVFTYLTGISIATIGSRFHYEVEGIHGNGIPPVLPSFEIPSSFGNFIELLPFAVQISMLGAIESLLSAVVADGMAGTIHNPDSELIAVGLANIVAPCFAGIPATGAIARTATNIKFGAKSPVAAIIHAIVVLLTVLFFAPALSYVPMSSLAALLMFVAYNFGDPKHVLHLIKVSPNPDVIVLSVCYFLTVVFDMVVGVGGGLLVAAVLFAGQMSAASTSFKKESLSSELSDRVGKDMVVVEIAGPLFFGTAPLVIRVIEKANLKAQAIVLTMDRVSHMDISGAKSLSDFVVKMLKEGKFVYIVGVQSRYLRILEDLMKDCPYLRDLRIIDSMATLQMAVNQVNELPRTPHIKALQKNYDPSDFEGLTRP